MKTYLPMVGLVSWLLIGLPAMAAESAIPPFVAEGRLLTQEFGTGTNLNYRTDARVVFLYSNGWWRVQSKYSYLHRSTGFTNVEDCMKIPDGTRSYIIFEGATNQGAMTLASACPIAFPRRTEMLVPWLALCPNPELPLTDGQRMRHFSYLPDYRPKIFSAPENEGSYATKFLAPENAFLSEFVFTNSGFAIDLNVESNNLEDEGTIRRFPAPFENGYTEMVYRIVESTNLHGVRFPVRAVFQHFCPNWQQYSPDWKQKELKDLLLVRQSELTVTRIGFSLKEMENRIVAPANIVGEDERLGVRISYLVADDQWKPVSDPEIARRARIARQ